MILINKQIKSKLIYALSGSYVHLKAPGNKLKNGIEFDYFAKLSYYA